MKYIVAILCQVGSFIVFAQDIPMVKILASQVYYSGNQNKTFDTDNKGLGAEIVLNSKNTRWNYFTKGRFTTVSGSQDFLDKGSAVNSSFTFYQSSFELGGTVYPMPRENGKFKLYVGLSGILSYNYMTLDSSSFTNIKPSYQAMSFGYAGLMGVELLAFKSVTLCAEFSQKYETADLAEVSQFGLNAFSLTAGLAW
jgi:hypothetical protein